MVTMLRPVVNFKRASLVLMTSQVIHQLYFLVPVFINTLQSSSKYLTPFPTAYPFTITGGSMAYYVQLAIECYASICFTAVGIGVDNSLAFYSSQIIGHLRTITYSLEQMASEIPDSDQLHKLIIKHRTLLLCCKTLQKIYGPIVLTMVLSTAVILCIVIFQLDHVGLMFVQIHINILMSFLYTFVDSYNFFGTNYFFDSLRQY